MNFFKSVFSDDPDPPTSPTSDPEPSSSSPQSPKPSQTLQPPVSDYEDGSDSEANPTTPSSGWSFGGLMKTLQVKSDWIETYRRDLQEFGSGLRKETEVLRDVASRAVMDLPDTIDIGASKAQISLESVGQALDSIGSTVWKSTSDIISHGKESLLALDDDSPDASNINSSASNSNVQSVNSGRYSRFDAQLRSIQCDVNTYVVEPDDVNDYNKWKSGFNLDERVEEIESLMKENDSIDDIYKRVVPNTVDHDVFWCRYHYRVHRLKQAENMRAELVKRAISTEDEEELSWDVDDDDEEEDVKKDEGSAANVSTAPQNEVSKVVEVSHAKSPGSVVERSEIGDKLEGEKKSDVVESVNEELSNKGVQSEGNSEVNDDQSSKKSEKPASEGKTEPCESGKDSDISVVSTQPSQEEDDMGWDEIEDIGSEDETKVSQSGGPNRDELRKRLSAADDDEDLSWDIEDDE